MKKHFFTGLILLLPIAITIVVLAFLLNILTTPFIGHIENLLTYINHYVPIPVVKHHSLFVFLSRIIVLIALFLFVLFLGFLGQRFFFNWLMKKINYLFSKIPLFKTIYKLIHDIISAVFAERKTFFEKIVITPFPFGGTQAIGFVPGNAPDKLQFSSNKDPLRRLKTCFIPTSPHPFSGFLILVEDHLLEKLDVNLEEMIKFLVSCGIYQPPKESSLTEVNIAPEDLPIDDPDNPQ